MRSYAFGFVLVVSALLSPVAGASVPLGLSEAQALPDLVAKILPGVVNISSVTVERYRVMGMEEFFNFWGIPMEREHRSSSLGSGFILDGEGYVLTNNHVVENASEVTVTLINKKQYGARIVGTDEKLDVALLQVRDEAGHVPKGLDPVKTGDSEKVRIAEPVLAIGNPFGLQHTVTMGIISAKNRTIGVGPFDNFLQTDAAINPGNSGGPLFNTKGEVIGINTLIFSRSGQSGGLGFAMPINEALKIIPDLKQYKRVPRPWLGVLTEAMTSRIQHYYGLGTERGVLVYNLVEGAPADDAGIKVGDVIVAVDGTKVDDPMDLERELFKLKPGGSAKVSIYRKTKKMEIAIPLKELPARLDKLPQGIV
ncbi:MAG TPA: trypsin-like peptidase domain-containing protein [Bdellovibrionota bacterium]|jgi:serine protease Do|nr:trypsin-like peptidase domain-containing protein [Bdellovibrionota bacterium]